MAQSSLSRLEAVVAFAVENQARLDFFQLSRLLIDALTRETPAKQAAGEAIADDWESRLDAFLRVRPSLSMAFSGLDINRIERADGRLRVEVDFFGLYGVTSPLPNFYTEDLFEAEQAGASVARGLIDIFHYSAYLLLLKALSRYRESTGLGGGLSNRQLTQKMSWVGLVTPASRRRFSHWSQISQVAPTVGTGFRSASNLQALVRTVSRSGNVRVIPCAQTAVRVARHFRTTLGRKRHQLGVQAHLGSVVQDRRNHVEIVLSGQRADDAADIVPGGRRHGLLLQAVQLFTRDNVRFRISIERPTTPETIGQARLGLGAGLGSVSQLGMISFYLGGASVA
jgi:type VI secretion system protein ImpH